MPRTVVISAIIKSFINRKPMVSMGGRAVLPSLYIFTLQQEALCGHSKAVRVQLIMVNLEHWLPKEGKIVFFSDSQGQKTLVFLCIHHRGTYDISNIQYMYVVLKFRQGQGGGH